MPKVKRKYSYPNHTTVRVHRDTLERLNQVRRRGESHDSAIQRILNGQGEIWVDILAVDGESPARHKVIFRLGEIAYMWDGNQFVPVDPSKVNYHLLK